MCIRDRRERERVRERERQESRSYRWQQSVAESEATWQRCIVVLQQANTCTDCPEARVVGEGKDRAGEPWVLNLNVGHKNKTLSRTHQQVLLDTSVVSSARTGSPRSSQTSLLQRENSGKVLDYTSPHAHYRTLSLFHLDYTYTFTNY